MNPEENRISVYEIESETADGWRMENLFLEAINFDCDEEECNS